ncbi:IS110 family transposase, partial [Streptomyces sp. NPDC014676]
MLEPRSQHPAVLTLLEQFGSPAQIRKAGRHRLVTLLRPQAPGTAQRPAEEIFTALRSHLIWLGKLPVVAGIVERLVPDELWELFQR